MTGAEKVIRVTLADIMGFRVESEHETTCAWDLVIIFKRLLECVDEDWADVSHLHHTA
jgi:hypothetical protein